MSTCMQEANGHLVDLAKLSTQKRTAIAKRLLVAADPDATPTRLLLPHGGNAHNGGGSRIHHA